VGELSSAWRVLDSLGESLAVVDRDYRLVWLREPLMDRDASERVIGRPCYEAFFRRKSPCDHQCPVMPAFAEKRPQVVERQFTDPQGRVRWREARAYPIVDGASRVALVARISFDITHRKLGEARQRREQDNLVRSLAAVNQVRVDEMPFQPAGGPSLSRRELEVLRLMAQGHSKPQVAGLLGISVNTVKRHAGNIFGKLGVNDRAQAAVWAARQGLV